MAAGGAHRDLVVPESGIRNLPMIRNKRLRLSVASLIIGLVLAALLTFAYFALHAPPPEPMGGQATLGRKSEATF